MFGRKKPEVLVVGAGPVGLLCALALTQKGVRVTIVDRDWRTGAHSYALALHSQSVELLSRLGLRDALLSQAEPIRSVGLYDAATRRTEIRVPADPTPPLLAMRQDAFESVLEESLRRAGVSVLWNHAVSHVELRDNAAVATKSAFGSGTSHWPKSLSPHATMALQTGSSCARALAGPSRTASPVVSVSAACRRRMTWSSTEM